MTGFMCLFIGRAINACRIYAILSNAGDLPAVQLKGAIGGFVAGAIVFGLPIWGTYAIIRHVATVT